MLCMWPLPANGCTMCSAHKENLKIHIIDKCQWTTAVAPAGENLLIVFALAALVIQCFYPKHKTMRKWDIDVMQHRGGTDLDDVPRLLCLQLPPHHPPHPPPLLGLLHHQSRLQGGKRDDSKNKFYLLRWCWPTTQWRTQGVSRKAPVTKVMMDLLCVTDSVVSAYLSDNKKRNKWCVSF